MRSLVLTLLLFALCQAGTQVKRIETPFEDGGASLSANADYLVGPSSQGYYLTVYDIASQKSSNIFDRTSRIEMTALSQDGRWLVAGNRKERQFFVLYTSGSPKDFIMVQNITLSCRFNSCPIRKIIIDEKGNRLAFIASSAVSFFQRPADSKKFNLTWIDPGFGSDSKFSGDLNTIMTYNNAPKILEINWRKFRVVEKKYEGALSGYVQAMNYDASMIVADNSVYTYVNGTITNIELSLNGYLNEIIISADGNFIVGRGGSNGNGDLVRYFINYNRTWTQKMPYESIDFGGWPPFNIIMSSNSSLIFGSSSTLYKLSPGPHSLCRTDSECPATYFCGNSKKKYECVLPIKPRPIPAVTNGSLVYISTNWTDPTKYVVRSGSFILNNGTKPEEPNWVFIEGPGFSIRDANSGAYMSVDPEDSTVVLRTGTPGSPWDYFTLEKKTNDIWIAFDAADKLLRVTESGQIVADAEVESKSTSFYLLDEREY